MDYFVTGGTGFIGRRLIKRLLSRGGTVFFLMPEVENSKLDDLKKFWGDGADRAVPLVGDVTQKNFGLKSETINDLNGRIEHFYHLAAIYDLKASAEIQQAVNVGGTHNAVKLAEKIQAGHFHHISSMAVAGFYKGIFREDMFEEGEGLDNPYLKTKHASEALVRKECSRPWRIYRPGMVVGDSKTGATDKADGPYFFFKLIQKARHYLPEWFPLIGLEGGYVTMVPIDYIIDALEYLSHRDGVDGRCFHLTGESRRLGDVLNTLARAAHAPQMAMRVEGNPIAMIPSAVRNGLMAFSPVRRITNQLLKELALPKEVVEFLDHPTRFDDREARKLLAEGGIEPPRLEDYAAPVWDYWERNLDPDLSIDRSLRGRVSGKTVIVTGASSGIGKATAELLARSGARVVVVARDPEKLKLVEKEIKLSGGDVKTYSCDITDYDAVDKMIEKIDKENPPVDILINNAGRSIRRQISYSYDRMHDFTRTMDLNYFAGLNLMLKYLPRFEERRRGHVLSVSSIGVLSNAPRFSAYVASKAAMDAFMRCAAAEFSHKNIHFTTLNMPLVRTPMIAPTQLYKHVPTISPDEAAEMIGEAIVNRSKQVATRLGKSASALYTFAPKLMEIGMNTAFQMFPDSSAARGKSQDEAEPSAEQIALAAITRGIHW